ncbi:ATP-dependent DNA helicase RecG [Clostridiales bacterium COT073_COT-073]|nr:ATP-dependent DNA helicase RecG [Clostridiales bacterium COT073_COT-073]
MNTPISRIKGIGIKTEKILKEMGIVSYYDLLSYYPKGYDFFAGLVSVSEIRMGEDNCLRVKIISQPKLQYFGKLSTLNFYVADEMGMRIKITYFRQPYLAKVMVPGRRMIIKGRPYWKKNELHMSNPLVLSEEEVNQLKAMPLVARYSLKKGISEKKLKQYLTQIFAEFADKPPIEDYISDEICQKYDLLPLWQSYKLIHFPRQKADIDNARKRLVFDEFFFFQAGLRKPEQILANDFPVVKRELSQCFIKNLPFALTDDQAKTIAEIESDLISERRMTRLVQGDVGSGKTAVAFAVSVMMMENGYQVALMAPTEVLAVQHYIDAKQRLEPLGIQVALLVGSLLAKEKREIYTGIQTGEINFIIGTHALIQEKAIYSNLGLVITDEQHRFGVMQRERLSQKGAAEKLPHILVMSATPIPRTLALILYQDMDISIIKSMPAERLPIQSFLRSGAARDKIYRFMGQEIKKGAAIYIICPAIEDNEELELTGVISYAEALHQKYPDWKIAYLYGGQEDKEEVMNAFAGGEIDVLISTTVIEVGVNVPRATVMLVENAERFGLAQLHQLRGRVGRGHRQSYCIFISDAKDKGILEKLEYVAKHTSGFDIAEYDLKMRGPGDAFGVKQHGMPLLQLADLYRDLPILEMVQKAGAEIEDSAAMQEWLKLYYGGKKEILSI